MEKFDFSFQQIADAANDIIIVTKAYPLDPPGPEIVYVNKAFTDLTGYSREEVLGKTPRLLQSSGTDAESKRAIKRALQKKRPVRVTIKNYAKSGREYWLDVSILPLRNGAGELTHFAAIERDVTEQKELERTLEKLSRTDPLTGLLNRRSFEEISAQEYSRFTRQGDEYSLLMLDVDHFKSVNDNYGHNIGDLVLKMLAEGCVANLRAHDVVARWGGEEFCVLLPCTDRDTAVRIAEKLRQAISTHALKVNSSEVAVTVSIGVSEVRASDLHHAEVLERADVALYDAKQSGRNRMRIGQR
jgi:diguanylate cyclase (GGDEF)-like protein/PAS domain S-box-containing protein